MFGSYHNMNIMLLKYQICFRIDSRAFEKKCLIYKSMSLHLAPSIQDSSETHCALCLWKLSWWGVDYNRSWCFAFHGHYILVLVSSKSLLICVCDSLNWLHGEVCLKAQAFPFYRKGRVGRSLLIAEVCYAVIISVLVIAYTFKTMVTWSVLVDVRTWEYSIFYHFVGNYILRIILQVLENPIY